MGKKDGGVVNQVSTDDLSRRDGRSEVANLVEPVRTLKRCSAVVRQAGVGSVEAEEQCALQAWAGPGQETTT